MANNLLGLDRQVLSSFLPNHEAIKAFERVFLDVSETLPDAIQSVELGSGAAQQQAGEALAGLAAIAQQLSLLLLAPVAQLEQRDSYTPPVNGFVITDQYSPSVDSSVVQDLYIPPVFPYDPTAVAITGGTVLAGLTNTTGLRIRARSANGAIGCGTRMRQQPAHR